MKKVFFCFRTNIPLIVFILVFSISGTLLNAQQRFNAGIKAGVSTTQVSGDTYSGYNKAGLVGGAFVRGIMNEKWTGQFEIMYIQKGSRHNGNPDKGDYIIKVNLRMNLDQALVF
jgi:hypothetical protein